MNEIVNCCNSLPVSTKNALAYSMIGLGACFVGLIGYAIKKYNTLTIKIKDVEVEASI